MTQTTITCREKTCYNCRHLWDYGKHCKWFKQRLLKPYNRLQECIDGGEEL